MNDGDAWREQQELRNMLRAFPVIVKALNRRGILTAADLNAIRFPDTEISVKVQMERAMEPKLQQRDEARKRADGTQS